jgi:hypothetical protein
MQHPERKYQLFPKDRPAATAPCKALDPEQAFALAMAQNSDRNEKTTGGTGSGLRIRIKENNLIRRRKISVPELGPMTTVHETPMDSRMSPNAPPLFSPSTPWLTLASYHPGPTAHS